MFANKSILLSFLVWGLVATSCASEITPTPQIEPIVTPIEPEPTSIVATENPTPVVQLDAREELVVRIAASKITSEYPFLIALSEISKRNLWQGVSPKITDMEKCWIVDIDSRKQCATEDIRNYIGNPSAPKIFFAPAYSDSLRELIVLDYYHPWIGEDLMDGYRLVIELKDGVWGEKSLTQVY